MRFWKEHTTLRAGLMAIFVALGFVLLIVGWKMTGQLTGLALMLAGVVLLLTALMLYNKPFEEPK
ncbi:MAG: hypothetical protein MR393_12695 [Intestinimonas massiliensis]|uniref:DUF6903 family protein n=2 Tax=Intestinimonas TaxID=1392389 RepID=UPI00242ECE64|nr:MULTISPECIES: hypothetical protein [Intestinimonas]MCI5563971.1 hypothetical protein [Intestinimonas massiliensis (ex Afouda et al. 2020)]MDY5339550.1 hypothetical protein [Intestinimonas sp.]